MRLNYSLFFRLVTMAWLVMCAGKWLSWQTTMKSSCPLRLSSCQWSPTCTSTCYWTPSTSRARSSRTIWGCIMAGVVFTGLIAALGKVTDKVGMVVSSMSNTPVMYMCCSREKFSINSELKTKTWKWLTQNLNHSFGIGEVHDRAPQGSRHGAGSFHGGGGCIRSCNLKDECIAHQGGSETIDKWGEHLYQRLVLIGLRSWGRSRSWAKEGKNV